MKLYLLSRLAPLAAMSAIFLLLSCTSVGPSSYPEPTISAVATRVENPPGEEFVPGEVLVKLRWDGGIPSSFSSLGYAIEMKEKIPDLGVLRLAVPRGRELEAARRLQEDPLVEWAEPDYLRRTQAVVPNDQLYRQFQWNLRKMRAEQAWDISTGSPEVVVAVLDTGVDASHPDLAGKLLPGYDFLNDNAEPVDDSGHGTHKAGVVGAVSNNGMGVAGVAWGSRIMPIKVLNSSGVGPDSVIAQGIKHAVDNGAKVINMSFGSSTGSKVLAAAVRYAAEKGALLVAAAGNTASMDNATIYPAAFPEVLAVAATDRADKAADFSQHHPYVGISAPGVDIVSTFWRGAGYGSYVQSSGTSDAAPHVSGLAALIWSTNPSLTNTQVRRIIEDTAEDLGPPGRDEYYGAGRIDALRALLAARPRVVITPTTTPTAVGPTPTPAPTPTPGPLATPATLPRTVWYFAEGATTPPFHLWLLLQNPNAVAATARVTYMKPDGSREAREMWLPPVSRRSIFVNQVVPNAEVSMKVESDSLILAERAMYFGSDGHGSMGSTAPSTRWYIAEGSTRADFDTWLLFQNPLDSPTNVVVTFFTSDGQRKELPLLMPPTSRRSIYVNDVVPDADVSATVISDQPIVAERSTYFRRSGGHGSRAANQLARTWYLAEGRVGDGFDNWLLVFNPGQIVANLKVTYILESGAPVVTYYAVRPGARLSIYVNEAVPAGGVGAQVESDQPIVVERSTYFAEGRGGHSVMGTPLLAREWYLPEGSTQPPFTEVITVLNPSSRVANLVVSFMRSDGVSEIRHFGLNPTSRLTLRVNDLLPNSEVSAAVASDVPIAVERSMYFADGTGGTGSFGIPRPSVQ